MIKLDTKAVKESFEQGWGVETVPHMQVAVYVMCGGGFLGRMAAEQPADFYIDARAAGKFKNAEIMQAVQCLIIAAGVYGMNPHEMPPMPRFHNMGVF